MFRRLAIGFVTISLVLVFCLVAYAQPAPPSAPPSAPGIPGGGGGGTGGNTGGPGIPGGGIAPSMPPAPPPPDAGGDAGFQPNLYPDQGDVTFYPSIDPNTGAPVETSPGNTTPGSGPRVPGGSSRIPGGSAQPGQPGYEEGNPSMNPEAPGVGPGPSGPSRPVVKDTTASPNLKIEPSAAKSMGNWNMLGRDAVHSCYSPENMTFPLRLQWKYITSQGSNAPASPIVADGIIYLCTATRLYTMNSDTGQIYWKFPADGPLNSDIVKTPLVGDQLVYFGTGDGKLYAIKKEDGTQAWRFATKGSMSTAPILSDGVIYIGGTDHALYALDAKTGKPKWPGGFRTRDTITGAPIISNGLVYFLSNEDIMYAAVATSGQLKWWRDIGSITKASSPVFGDNMIYLVSGNILQAFQAQSGYPRWAITLTNDVTTIPVFAKGALYFACTDHMLYAVKSDGKMKWKTPVDLKVLAYSTPVVVGDTLVIGGSQGLLMAVDTETGHVKWQYRVMPSALAIGAKLDLVNLTSPLVVSNGSLYFFSDDGTLFTFRSDAPDTTPPDILLTVPLAGSTVPGASAFQIAALVSDEGSGVDWKSIKLLFDGKSVDFKTKPERGIIYFNRKKSVEGEDSVQEPLTDGRHTVLLSLSDWIGNTALKEWSFQADNHITVTTEDLIRQQQQQRQPGFGGRGGGGGGGGDKGN